jgi:hypothetical protein
MVSVRPSSKTECVPSTGLRTVNLGGDYRFSSVTNGGELIRLLVAYEPNEAVFNPQGGNSAGYSSS